MTENQRLDPPPVEPLSDVAWARVERGLWARLDPEVPSRATPPGPRRWWLVAAPFAAAAAIAAVVIATHEPAAEISYEPSRVVTRSAPSSVSFADSHIELDAATALAMSHEDEHPTVLLERGAAWFTVAPRHRRPAFIVRAGDATVRVVGTRFRVARSEERIAVEVDHGLVDVQFRGGVMAVGDGQHWSSEAPAQIATVTAVTPPADPAALAVPEAPPAPPPVTRPAVTRPATAVTSPEHVPARPAASAAIQPEPGADGADATGVDRDRAEYDRLAALEPTSPTQAFHGYLALARGTSRWADPALFAAARLAVDRRERRAEILLEMYLQRFPAGANATDARQLLARLKGDRP